MIFDLKITMEKKELCVLSLGSNVGDRLSFLRKAIRLIKEENSIKDISSVYETQSWGYSGSDYLNMCVLIETNMSCTKLLTSLLAIEAEIGRIREEIQYIDRVIDIDIVSYGDCIINKKDLVVPHPRMHSRNFVLLPLLEIQYKWTHPILNINIHQLFLNSEDNSLIELYGKL